jgi:hypothetical protein
MRGIFCGHFTPHSIRAPGWQFRTSADRRAVVGGAFETRWAPPDSTRDNSLIYGDEGFAAISTVIVNANYKTPYLDVFDAAPLGRR